MARLDKVTSYLCTKRTRYPDFSKPQQGITADA
jgi:hypothetical protein